MGWGKVEEIKADAEEVERLNQKIYRMMATNCGHDEEYFLDIVHEKGHADWFLDAEEFKSPNMANHLHVPDLKISAEIKFKFG